eukprot:8996403-Ditylum_brightwellii.AAC.1
MGIDKRYGYYDAISYQKGGKRRSGGSAASRSKKRRVEKNIPHKDVSKDPSLAAIVPIADKMEEGWVYDHPDPRCSHIENIAVFWTNKYLINLVPRSFQGNN